MKDNPDANCMPMGITQFHMQPQPRKIDVTIEDAKAFTKPMTLRINQRVVVDEEPIEFVCNENQQFRQRIKIG